MIQISIYLKVICIWQGYSKKSFKYMEKRSICLWIRKEVSGREYAISGANYEEWDFHHDVIELRYINVYVFTHLQEITAKLAKHM